MRMIVFPESFNLKGQQLLAQDLQNTLSTNCQYDIAV